MFKQIMKLTLNETDSPHCKYTACIDYEGLYYPITGSCGEGNTIAESLRNLADQVDGVEQKRLKEKMKPAWYVDTSQDKAQRIVEDAGYKEWWYRKYLSKTMRDIIYNKKVISQLQKKGFNGSRN